MLWILRWGLFEGKATGWIYGRIVGSEKKQGVVGSGDWWFWWVMVVKGNWKLTKRRLGAGGERCWKVESGKRKVQGRCAGWALRSGHCVVDVARYCVTALLSFLMGGRSTEIWNQQISKWADYFFYPRDSGTLLRRIERRLMKHILDYSLSGYFLIFSIMLCYTLLYILFILS